MAGFVVDVSAATVCVTIGVAVVGVVVVAFVIAIVVGTIRLRIVVVVVVIVVVVFVIVVFLFVFVVVVLGFLWTIVGGVFFRGIDACGRSMIDGSFRHSPVEVDVWHKVRVADSAEIG